MHAPPSVALLTPLPLSRTASPAPTFVQRSPSSASKCERLLRETLRRADLASTSRASTPCTPYFAAHEVFIADCCSREESDSDSDQPQPRMSHTRRASTTSHRAHSPAPPSPARPQHSPRSATSHPHRASHSMSSTAPVLRHPAPLRPAVSSARSDPTQPSSSRPATPLMPHEVALRSRLQGVLDASHVRPGPRRATGPTTHFNAPSSRTHHRARSVSVRTHAEGDAAWWEPASASPVTEATPSLAHHSDSAESLDVFASQPSTPPSPSPSSSPNGRPGFDVRTASQLCRNKPGLVSFRDVEGLGAPPEDDLDADTDEDASGRWWGIYNWSPFKSKKEKRLSLS